MKSSEAPANSPEEKSAQPGKDPVDVDDAQLDDVTDEHSFESSRKTPPANGLPEKKRPASHSISRRRKHK